MNQPNFQRANTLKSAYLACTLEPLDGERIEQYYVDLSAVRKTLAVDRISTILDLQEADNFSTILFTGHRGSGKSTELKRIQKIWKESYHVIYLEVNEETDINDANYTDLYLIVIKQVEFALRKLGLKFDQRLLSSFEAWFKEITEENEESVEKSVSVESEASLEGGAPFIAKLMVKLLAQIKGSDKQKTTIRQTLEKDISRLKADINLLLRDAYVKLQKKYPDYKGLLIIFDNLDRISPKVADHLFFEYAAQLQELHCTIIYTVPISVLCSPKNPLSLFDGNPHIVPMVNIYQFDRNVRDLNYNQIGLDTIASSIEKRVNVDAVFDSRAELLELAKASGGNVRQLMQMMRSACLTARTKNHPKILAEDVIYAIKEQQFSFERLIPNDHYPLLAQVYLNKDVSKDDIGQLMLFNTSVLEYNGDNRWNYPNPVVMQNEFFQKALAEITT
ncbi:MULTISPECIES: P-loop NTPase fold protein [Nostocales]|uniref:ATP-binding protein n=1 Tax=Dolichospermum flos-aquae UHCC 0037 TaxID=2590026 RepID=A0ACC7S921_DOLFA|nr:MULTISPECIES: P-loop NTPase fold protein [Nostocales]MBO1067580.1 ATP-binding protein [Anabaena sp. 54]MCX5982406.1 AAA family ATPase [Nostocales cyanobacterium LacPavin_0920_SED1_MAG_38_18]MTJ44910.1 ATP-binding protein [Dolichospermum flos-aquae UHCC 0037]